MKIPLTTLLAIAALALSALSAEYQFYIPVHSRAQRAQLQQGGSVVAAPVGRGAVDSIPGSIGNGYTDLSDRMVGEFGMDPGLRECDSAIALSELSGCLRNAWREARKREILEAARECSAAWMQITLNACIVVPAGYVLWIVGSMFWKGNYLPGTFYRQGGVLLFLLWLLTSWLAQIRLNTAARSLPDKVAKRFSAEAHIARILPVASEVDRLVCLAASLGKKQDNLKARQKDH